MGIKRPRLRDLVLDAQARQRGERPELAYGPRRAVVQCLQHPGRRTIAEVRGQAVFGASGPHDLRYATERVLVSCRACPQDTRLWQLNLKALRARLREPHRGVLKLPVETVGRRVERH